MAGRYETWVGQLRLAFAGQNWRNIIGGFAAALGDKGVLWALQAAKEHLPLLANDPASVQLTAAERQIEPGGTETQAALAARLVNAVPAWQGAGSPLGMLVSLYGAQFSTPVLVQQNGLALQITGTPNLGDLQGMTALPSWGTATTLPNVNPALPAESTGGRPALAALTKPWWTVQGTGYMDAAGNQFNSRFELLFPADVTNPSLGTAANLARLQRIMARWRPGKATCTTVAVCTSGQFVGWPVRTVGAGGNVGPSTVTQYAGA